MRENLETVESEPKPRRRATQEVAAELQETAFSPVHTIQYELAHKTIERRPKQTVKKKTGCRSSSDGVAWSQLEAGSSNKRL